MNSVQSPYASMDVKSRRIPSLDGLRAIAICLVIYSHITVAFDVSVPLLWRWDLGNLGVRIFFVISGFLITDLLAKERHALGRIDILAFYRRRILRIVPAYLLMLSTLAVLIPFGFVSANYSTLPAAVLYVSNYVPVPWAIGHTWSLSVEEQFYLIWPATVIVLGLTGATRACTALLFFAPLFRACSQFGLWPTNPRYAFESVCDALAAGCLLALLREELWNVRIYRKVVGAWKFWLLPLALLGFQAIRPPELLWNVLGIPAFNLVIAMSIDKVVREPTAAFGAGLNCSPVVWIGTLSYSLYLWQQMFLDQAHSLPLVTTCICIFGAAMISRYFVELPFMRIGKAYRKKMEADVFKVSLQPIRQTAEKSGDGQQRF